MDVALGLINWYLLHLSLLFACENLLSIVLYRHLVEIKSIYMFNDGNFLFAALHLCVVPPLLADS